MKKWPAALLMFFGAVCVALPAFAQDEGFYISGAYGLALYSGFDNKGDAGDFKMDFDSGDGMSLAVGYDFGTKHPDIGVGRTELEYSTRSGTLNETDYSGVLTAGDGDLKVRSLMINTFGESRDKRPWIPYAGLGVGVAEVSLEQVSSGGVVFVDDSDVVFAFQAGVGLGLMISDPLTLDFGYRFQGTTKPEFTDVNGLKFDSEYYSHLFLVGARVTF